MAAFSEPSWQKTLQSTLLEGYRVGSCELISLLLLLAALPFSSHQDLSNEKKLSFFLT